MANTRRKIVVLADKIHLREQGISVGSILDAQISGNRATPFQPGKRTLHLTRGEWRFATAQEVSGKAHEDHHLAPKDDPAVGDGSISTEGEGNPQLVAPTEPDPTEPDPTEPDPTEPDAAEPDDGSVQGDLF